MKYSIQNILLLVAATAFTLLGINRLYHYNTNRSLERAHVRLSQAVAAADRLVDHGAAVRAYKALTPVLPEVHLRILQRQWRIALAILEETRIAKANAFPETEVAELYNSLTKHLREMEDRCDLLLADAPSLPGRVAWRLSNVRALVKIVGSFVVLDTETNYQKVRAALKEAVSDLKSGIDIVDQTAASSLDKNICRWNLEILGQQEPLKRASLTESDVEHRLGLRDNLQAIIPDKGGYAPGESMGHAMKK